MTSVTESMPRPPHLTIANVLGRLDLVADELAAISDLYKMGPAVMGPNVRLLSEVAEDLRELQDYLAPYSAQVAAFYETQAAS